MSNLGDHLDNKDNQNGDRESTKSASGDDNANNYESLKDMIRSQLSNILTKADIRREINEMLMLLPPQRREMDTEYVKIEDLKNIVRTVVYESLTMQKMYNSQFSERLEKLEKVLWNLNRRVDDMTEHVKLVSTAFKLQALSPKRLGGGKEYETELKTYTQLPKPSGNGLELSAAEEQMLTQMLDNVNLEDMPSSSNRHKVSQPLADESMQRAAAHRQYEANMLMYRKSQFSLQLNNRTQWTPNQESQANNNQTDDD
ncbi:hypothetical protein KR093_002895 [Drosophila rubida]|uniref:Uncharacterized protein n=1 Tax=Drosophila rubida TaxID=30044 RepID=A0AAD4PG66_9MUSC|nr:hypothetical protein KR093_002895 [Drosophila rubida]